MGSASPRNADPMALIASSGLVLKNDAISEASWTFCLEKSTSASPDRPADLPNTANDAAASIACFLLCPIDVAAVDAHASIFDADCPNRTPVLLTVSFRSDAAAMDLAANAPIAASATPAPMR